MIAREIVNAARFHSPGFSTRVIPDGAAISALSRIQREQVGEIASSKPELLAVPNSIPMRDTNGNNGILNAIEDQSSARPSLPIAEPIRILDNIRVGEYAVDLKTLSELYDPDLMSNFPAVAFQASRIWISDHRIWGAGSSGWETLPETNLVWWGVMLPAKIEALDSEISSPSQLHSVMEIELALWMAERLGNNRMAARLDIRLRGEIDRLHQILLSIDTGAPTSVLPIDI